MQQNPWLHRYATLVAVCTLFLVIAGASVTSKEAGLSVPDWPLSYGQVIPQMTGGVLFETGHRMIATIVGILTILLAIWIARVEKPPHGRAWMRRLGWVAVSLVVAQGLLGGATVLLLQPPPISIAHACLAQLFFSVTVAIAVSTLSGHRNAGVDTASNRAGGRIPPSRLRADAPRDRSDDRAAGNHSDRG